MRTMILLLAMLPSLGCDVRGFFGESFLSDAPQRCSARAPCPSGTSCDEASGLCRSIPDGAIPGCRAHGECGPAGLCRLDDDFPGAGLAAVGGCVPPDRVCVIDGDRCLAGGDGSPERPLCDPAEAPARGGRCAFALVRPRKDGQRYGSLRLQSGSLVLVGPGRDAAQPVTLGGIEVVDGASLTIVDLIVESPERSALRCADGGRLSLRAVVVQASALGVDSQGCASVTIAASRISGNRNDGLHLEAQEFRIVNSLILGNAFDPGATASGVYIKGGRGIFSFNTVAGNGRADQDGGGVACTAGPERFVTLTDSIVSGNGIGMSRTQFLGSCKLERVVVGSDSLAGGGAIKMDPQLDPVSFHLTDKSDGCIDRAQKDPTVLTDYDGTARPQRQGYDIGFHELK